MERLLIEPRPDWKAKCEEIGFFYHSVDNYWREDRCYKFKVSEIQAIEHATYVLHDMCIELAKNIIEKGNYHRYNLPNDICSLIERSWNDDHPYLYGRFDLGYNGKEIKMLEYNADTPTCLLEAAVCQWQWMVDHFLNKNITVDQFNGLHDSLIDRWKLIKDQLPLGCRLYFTALRTEVAEDECHINYLMDTAMQAGFEVSSISLEDIGWDGTYWFLDVKDEPISALFKLYPWEFIVVDAYGQHISKTGTQFIEPAWKMLLSNKTILPLLWEQFPNHPLLLPAYFDNLEFKPNNGEWVKKPALAREGENLTIYRGPEEIKLTHNPYYDKSYVWQEYFRIPTFNGYTPVIGSWVIGDDAKGMGIREDPSPITNNKSHFIPHYFD